MSTLLMRGFGLARLIGWIALATLVFGSVGAAESTGTIEGRVLNARKGEYLERVRLTVEGTALATLSESDGSYRLQSVPAGGVRVRAFYTGFEPLLSSVTVTAGQTVRHDISLGGQGEGGVVRLDAFEVATSREMDAAAIAINEQRYAPNIKAVSSTDEFGGVSEGSVGEFLRFMPGVSIDYGTGTAREVSINGAPSANVPVAIDGFTLASTGGLSSGGGSDRPVELDTMVALNILARIEVLHSPTPESPESRGRLRESRSCRAAPAVESA